MLATMAQDVSLLANAQWVGDMILDTIPTDGVGVCLNGTIALTGLAPNHAEFDQIVSLLNEKSQGQVFCLRQHPDTGFPTRRFTRTAPPA